MERCPLCRATLNGAETCRRCRAELHSAIRVAHEGRRLVGAAIHYLSRDDAGTAAQLLHVRWLFMRLRKSRLCRGW
jgi:hypothetical protein